MGRLSDLAWNVAYDPGTGPGLTFADYMAATPEERAQYWAEAAQGGAQGLGGALVNLGISTPEQHQAVLATMDPAIRQQAGLGEQGIRTARSQAAADTDFSDTMHSPTGALIGLGAMGGLAALGVGAGAGAGSAAAAPLSEGAAWSAGLGGADLAAMEEAVGLSGITTGGATGMMPAAVPAADATFGGALTQSAPGVFTPAATAAGVGAGAGAGAAAGSSALSRVFNGDGNGDDYLRLAGALAPAALGVYGANQQANSLENIANQARADRAPFLNKSLQYLNDPAAYAAGPGKTFMDATLRGLSAKVGNPIDNPTALGLATEAGMRDWRDAVTGFGNMGLAGEDSRMNILGQAARAQGGIYDSIGYGLGNVLNPPTPLEDLIRRGRGQLASLV